MKCGCTNCKCEDCLCGPHATFFDALGNHNRLLVVNTLRKKQKNVTEISSETGLEQSAVSHALTKLENAGIVRKEKDGKFRIYAIEENIDELMHIVDNHVRVHCRGDA
ncbi:MAG: metalloregulator ArsR/SmtB family transcription factor [Candidatus Woesearchaeota archaeon]|nr:metalloregulator ArsR/SmtB family transcription factor [Candidatus Woesearchaeota archaeon]